MVVIRYRIRLGVSKILESGMFTNNLQETVMDYTTKCKNGTNDGFTFTNEFQKWCKFLLSASERKVKHRCESKPLWKIGFLKSMRLLKISV